MGIGWTPAHRETVVGAARIGDGNMTVASSAIVVDGPAAIRGLMFRPCSANSVARLFVSQLSRRAASKTLDGVIVSVAFDVAACMPPQREVVAASRAGARPPKPLPANFDPSKLVAGHLSRTFDWDPILSTPRAKAAAWELIGRAVFAALCAVDGCTAEVVTAGALWVRDVSSHLPVRSAVMYGEADLLVTTRAADLAACGHAVEIVTVDYDQVVQALLASRPGAAILRFKRDTIDVGVLCGKFGGPDRNKRLSAAFFLLCAFRSDYSKSLCRPSGTTVAQFVAAMNVDNGTPVVSERAGVDGTRQLFLCPRVLRGVVRRWKPLAVSDGIACILWTIAYFAEYDARHAEWGGPPAVVLPAEWATAEHVQFAADVHI